MSAAIPFDTLPYPAAGILADHPELAVQNAGGRGYAWPPFADVAEFPLIGASSLGNVLDQGWLGGWKVKVASEVAADNREQLAGMNKKDAIALIKAETRERTSEAANNGSAIHAYLAATLGGHPHPGLAEHLRSVAAVGDDWLARWAPIPLAIERTLYAPWLRVAGTTDLVARIDNPPDPSVRPGVYGIDWKTKCGKRLSSVTPGLDNAMQACALAGATHIAIPEQQQVYELPPLDGFLVVYLAEDGHRTQPIKVESPALRSLVVAARDAIELQRTLGSSVFGPPLQHHTSLEGITLVNNPKENA